MMLYRVSEGECHGEMSSLMQEIDSTVKQRVYSDDCTNPVKLYGRHFWDLDMRLMTLQYCLPGLRVSLVSG